MRLHRLRAHRLPGLRRQRGGRLRRARRGGPVPAARRHRRRQDDAARRGLLRAVRRRCRARARATRGCAATTPRRARAPRSSWSSRSRERRLRIVRRPAQERPKLRGDGTTREGHACTVQELDRRRAASGPCSPPGPTRPRHELDRPARHVVRPVLPGRAAAAGRVRDLPARRQRRAPGRARTPVRHRPLHARRALADRPPQGRLGRAAARIAGRARAARRGRRGLRRAAPPRISTSAPSGSPASASAPTPSW